PVFLLAWLAGGLVALVGAVSLGELGASWPRSGGEYAYLSVTWGRGLGFAAGWLQLLAIFPGSLATIAVAVATYQVPSLFGDALPKTVVVAGLSVPTANLCAAAILV